MNEKERCEYLEMLGFKVALGSYNVGHGSVNFNFSTCSSEASILSMIINKAYSRGMAQGKSNTQDELCRLLGVKV